MVTNPDDVRSAKCKTAWPYHSTQLFDRKLHEYLMPLMFLLCKPFLEPQTLRFPYFPTRQTSLRFQNELPRNKIFEKQNFFLEKKI
ncbi:hypothetical protein CEXT_396661 [Caerostris extrusa]|uniref:Uncharacterized protein n=1 Tax=Caerostris extrusa TaxID=172846 RepID=A0AAV4N6L9_CAEEX|nr:hypothetical protein CEXT_396661 [Caerostris extrusa]